MSTSGHCHCKTQKQEGFLSAPKASDTGMFVLYSFLIKRTKKSKTITLVRISRQHKGYRRDTGVLMAIHQNPINFQRKRLLYSKSLNLTVSLSTHFKVTQFSIESVIKVTGQSTMNFGPEGIICLSSTHIHSAFSSWAIICCRAFHSLCSLLLLSCPHILHSTKITGLLYFPMSNTMFTSCSR